MATTYKISIIGDPRVGKTTFVNRHVSGIFTTNYIATNGVKTEKFLYKTTNGHFLIEFHDYSGHEKDGLEKSLAECDGAIVMFSIDSKSSAKNALNWRYKLEPKIPYVMCCTKCDLGCIKPEIPAQTIFISSKPGYNNERPLLNLLQKIRREFTCLKCDRVVCECECDFEHEYVDEYVDEYVNDDEEGEEYVDIFDDEGGDGRAEGEPF
jgi:GTP-binding nuclear protein Ran